MLNGVTFYVGAARQAIRARRLISAVGLPRFTYEAVPLRAVSRRRLAGSSCRFSAARSDEEFGELSRLSLFNSPLLLGFEHFERTLDRVAKASSDGYPPYNIEQVGDDRLRITLAVAGFTMDDLNIQLESNQLVVRGKQADDRDRIYLHRGIAARQFQRNFVLAEGIEVAGAVLDNGLLNIDLIRPTPPVQVRTIDIRRPASKTDGPATIDIA